MRFFAGPSLLVIDELGYLALPTEAASALFHVVSQRHLKTSNVHRLPAVPDCAASPLKAPRFAPVAEQGEIRATLQL